MRKRTIVIALATCFSLALYAIQVANPISFVANRINLIVESGFYIPEESSISTFYVIKWNEGSGEYWLYAEDKNNFDTVLNKGPKVFSEWDYIVIPKKTVGSDFDFAHVPTWGDEFYFVDMPED